MACGGTGISYLPQGGGIRFGEAGAVKEAKQMARGYVTQHRYADGSQ